MASKNYNPQGVVTVTIYFKGTYYVMLTEGESEQPLLDSRFPDVSEKGRGYQLRSYAEGVDGWRELRKGVMSLKAPASPRVKTHSAASSSLRAVSIWQTSASLKAQMDRAQAKLEDLRESKGTDAMEAAAIAQQRMQNLTVEALRVEADSEADAKATATPASTQPARGASSAADGPASASAKDGAAGAQASPSSPAGTGLTLGYKVGAS
jgi:hypothetical protein